jgi:hypothetical protein
LEQLKFVPQFNGAFEAKTLFILLQLYRLFFNSYLKPADSLHRQADSTNPPAPHSAAVEELSRMSTMKASSPGGTITNWKKQETEFEEALGYERA